MFDIIWNRCTALNIYYGPVQKDQHLFIITPKLRKEVIETQLVPFLKKYIMLIAKKLANVHNDAAIEEAI